MELGTIFGAIFNAMPNTSYSQNAGLVAFTGVISRHVGTVAGSYFNFIRFVSKTWWNYCSNA